MTNVNLVVENGACDGCCECISVCSRNNIYIMLDKKLGHPVPCIAEDDCQCCGDCLRACKQASLIELQLS